MNLTILAHGDSDGVCSAALVAAALREDYREVKVVFTHPAGLLSDFRESAKGDVVIVDVAISEHYVRELEIAFKNYRHGIITYIDHHPEPLSLNPRELSIEVVHSLTSSASELTYKYFTKLGKLGREYERVALYGAIGDYLDETAWVKQTLEKWDKRQIYFEAGVLIQGLEGSKKMYDFKRHVVRHLSKNKRPSQLGELVVRALVEARNNEVLYEWVKQNVVVEGDVAYVIDPPGSLGIAAVYARGITERKVGIAAERRDNLMIMSLRAKKDSIDLNRFLRQTTVYLGGCGGGHPHAAGCRIPYRSFRKLIDMLNGELRSLTK
ncbi:MAG: DHH family phosphoesterase [Desulfurococcales archaeon]|nr:DHH family phosphoesterase [Desulfurococcales archaeon]